MENASKALLIAGAVLLSMMILTVGIILYNKFSDTTDRYSDNLSATELNKFNANFEVFRGRTDVTAQEIVSLINMVAEYKKKTPMNVGIEVDGTLFEESSDTIEFLKGILDSYDEENKKNITFTFDNISYEENVVTGISFISNIT